MREWFNQYICRSLSIITRHHLYHGSRFIFLMIRKFALNHLYKQFNESENWYVTRKIAKWITNFFHPLLLFIYLETT